MLARIRSFLIEGRFMSAGPFDGKARVDLSPEDVVNRSFIEGVAYFQGNKEQGYPDGMIGQGTFALLKEYGFEYTLEGGEHTPGRGIVSRNAPPEKIYDYFRDMILDQGGIFSTIPEHVNLVGIRGGKLEDDSIKHVENTFNKWNDTLVVLSVNADGKKEVQLYEGTTDPGVARKGVATLPEGTHSMSYGWHNASSSYRALNPAHEGQVPVFRDGNSYLGQGSGSGSWLNMHTTHGYDQGALAGPGGYSLGCAVINGQDQYESFISKMAQANGKGQEIIYYTLVSASRLDSLEIKHQSPHR